MSLLRGAQIALILLASSGPVYAACSADKRGGEAVIQAITRRNAPALAALIDTDALAGRVARGLEQDDSLRSELPKAFAAGRERMAGNLIQTLANSGMQLARQPAPEGRTVLRKQGASLGSGIDYVEFHLDRRGCLIDWTSLMMGSPASAVIRQSMLMTRKDANILSTLFGLKQVDGEQVARLRALADAMVKGDSHGAILALEQMGSLAEASFELTMLRVGLLASDSEGEAYRQALQGLAERFGDDERAQFMLIDHYYYTEEFEKGLKSVARMQARVGVDEETELLRGGLLKLLGRQQEAESALRHMVELAPERPDAHSVLVGHFAETRAYGKAVEAMDAALEHDITFTESAMRKDPTFVGLLASPEYAAWKARDAD